MCAIALDSRENVHVRRTVTNGCTHCPTCHRCTILTCRSYTSLDDEVLHRTLENLYQCGIAARHVVVYGDGVSVSIERPLQASDTGVVSGKVNIGCQFGTDAIVALDVHPVHEGLQLIGCTNLYHLCPVVGKRGDADAANTQGESILVTKVKTEIIILVAPSESLAGIRDVHICHTPFITLRGGKTCIEVLFATAGDGREEELYGIRHTLACLIFHQDNVLVIRQRTRQFRQSHKGVST